MVTRQGALWVYSYASAKADVAAHAAQCSRVLPEMCARHLGPWLNVEAPHRARQDRASLGLGLLGIAAKLLFQRPER
jgi:hypothetical protein